MNDEPIKGAEPILERVKDQALEIVDETQDFEVPKAAEKPPFSIGDPVVASQLYISICRGHMREKVKAAGWEVIEVSSRSVTVRPWGTIQKYGDRWPLRYIRKPNEKELAERFPPK